MSRLGDLAAQDTYNVPLPEQPWYQPFTNVTQGLARDIPRAVNWFGEQARKSPEAAQADVRNTMGGLVEQLYTLPERTMGASETMRTEGIYNPAPAVETALTVMGGGVAGTGEKAGAALGSGPIRKASALPMDEASRLARATEQGYTIDAFKGGQPYDWDTLPVYTGFGKVKPGTENRIPKELTSINSPNADYAGFFSNSPDVANRFAAPFEHGAVWPTKLKFENPVVIDAQGQHAAAFQFPSIARERGTTAEMDKFRGAFKADSPHDGVILKNTKDEGDVYVPRNSDQIRSRFAAFDPENKGSGFLLGSGATDKKTAGAIQGIRAYHSSPHDFDKFDLAKIGTGEGAQVYGHGLYFAENPAVSGQGGQYWNQFRGRFDIPERNAALTLSLNKFDREAAIAEAQAKLIDPRMHHSEASLARAQKELELLQSGKPVGPRTYEVNIKADPAQMLDWDKPLGAQVSKIPPNVLEAGRLHARERYGATTGKTQEDELWSMMQDPSRIPGRFLIEGADKTPMVSAALNEAGIPGIKYFDQASRGPSQQIDMLRKQLEKPGWRPETRAEIQSQLDELLKQPPPSSNYVVFDPSIVDIMKKYGIAGAAPAGMGALAAQDAYRRD